MSIQVMAEIEQMVHSIFATCNYRDETAVLNEASQILQKRDQLRLDVQAGLEQLDAGQRLPGEQVFDRLEEKAKRIEQAAADKR